MFGMFKKLKGAGSELAKKSVKAENKDLMEGMISAAALIAYADGDLGDDEVEKIQKIIGSSASLEAFGIEATQYFDKQCSALEASYRMGRLSVMKEIEDCKGNKEEAEMILIMAIEVAYADGDCDADEDKELKAIAVKLGLKLDDYI